VRRADRLFQIVQRLRLRRRTSTTAAQLAEELGVSERTIYRDIQDLILSGVPIQGEAGVGYALPSHFDLPPLMFTEDEIEALVLGARVVKSFADKELARAADDVLAKVEAVLPKHMRERLASSTLFAMNFRAPVSEDMAGLRAAIKEMKKIRFSYEDGRGASTSRVVQPLGLFYWGATWSLGAWCELRVDFRNFRVDRMKQVQILEDRFEPVPGRTLADLFAAYRDEGGRR
jgi:predicted DNA-binding transcriptional regulator YafY